MSLTSLDKLQLGYEHALCCHAAYVSIVVANTSLAMSTPCPGMLCQCIQQWEKTKIAEGQALKQHACVALVFDIACLQWPPACMQALGHKRLPVPVGA